MLQFSYLSAIYDTTLIREDYQKVIADPVKIEFFRGGNRPFTVHVAPNRVLPTGIGSQVAFFNPMAFNPERYYISLTARSPAQQVRDAIIECENEIDGCVADLAIIYSPHIFNFPVYRGLVVESNVGKGAAYVRLENPVAVNPSELQATKLPGVRAARAQNQNIQSRYELMARFFSKAISYEPSEEKLLFLWTVLEIYPMENTTNIQPVSDLLAQIVNRDAAHVKNALSIGKLFGLRSDLVHNGRLALTREQLGEVIDKLEKICLEVLRRISGEPYRGALHVYL
jgi:hypothetical protein